MDNLMTQVLEHKEFTDVNVIFMPKKWWNSFSQVTLKNVTIGKSVSKNLTLGILLHEVGHIKTTIVRYKVNNIDASFGRGDAKTTRQCELRASGWGLRFARRHYPNRYKAIRRVMLIGYRRYVKTLPIYKEGVAL